MHGVVCHSLLAVVKCVVRGKDQLDQAEESWRENCVIAFVEQRLVQHDEAHNQSGHSAPNVEVGRNLLLEEFVDFERQQVVINATRETADKESLHVAEGTPVEVLTGEAESWNEQQVVEVLRRTQLECNHVIHVDGVDDRERPPADGQHKNARNTQVISCSATWRQGFSKINDYASWIHTWTRSQTCWCRCRSRSPARDVGP